MSTYLYSKWKNAPSGFPTEFFSELDAARWEKRKVEVFFGDRLSYASTSTSTSNTRLGTIPVPPIHEIRKQNEFEVREITKNEFEVVWKKATGT